MDKRTEVEMASCTSDGTGSKSIPSVTRRVAGYVRRSDERTTAAIRTEEQNDTLPGGVRIARKKKCTEGWADFAEDLSSLADRAFPDLQPEARECLALQKYLQQLDQPQVAFSVKQTRPKTLDDAVTATLEMESYAVSQLHGHSCNPSGSKSHR